MKFMTCPSCHKKKYVEDKIVLAYCSCCNETMRVCEDVYSKFETGENGEARD